MTWNVCYFHCSNAVRLKSAMPTYEYRCPKGHAFEHFFRTISSAESQMKCPECGELAERIMSGGTGLLFKGSGFYITDYGKDGKKDQRKAPESSGESSSSGDSGTKPSTDKPPSKGSGSSDA
jgi:putative FmdB family regulatory protein